MLYRMDIIRRQKKLKKCDGILVKQEIIADLSRITEEEQAILDGKTEVEKERYSSGQKFVMDAGKLLERGKLIDIRPTRGLFVFRRTATIMSR